jgi:spoIIIJ-associated protein
MDEKTIALINKTIKELIEKMGFTGEVSISKSDQDDDGVICDITTDVDSNFLIGQHGINLQALQHIARLIVRKHVPEKIRFTLDINNYRKQKNQSVIEQAIEVAKEVLKSGQAISLPPMSTYERRLAHLELYKNPDVSTESIGEGETRRIMVKPSSMLE